MEDDFRTVLGRHLRVEVARLYKRDHTKWKQPIREILNRLWEADVPAVFFGGTLRSIPTSRIFFQKLGRPRDIDLVVSDISLESLRERFAGLISRETRFG